MESLTIRPIAVDDIDRCDEILRLLPKWFGIESSIREYIERLKELDGFVAPLNDEVIGFTGLKRYGTESVEIDVIAIEPQLRRNGIGHRLLRRVEEQARRNGAKLLHMKTLAPSDPDAGYAETRAFWEANGYIPMDAHLLWGPEDPCQVMVKPL